MVEANPSLAKLWPTWWGAAAFSCWESLLNQTKVIFKTSGIFFRFYISKLSQCWHTLLPGEPLIVFVAEISRLVDEAFSKDEQNTKYG